MEKGISGIFFPKQVQKREFPVALPCTWIKGGILLKREKRGTFPKQQFTIISLTSKKSINIINTRIFYTFCG